MLTFFRRLRQSLLNTGAISKYALYAVGEIALVVIGILIALQINNWNEWRKDRVKEVEILNDVLKNIELNRELGLNSIEGTRKFDYAANVILKAFDEDQPYHDSLSLHFLQARRTGSTLLTFSKSGYESLKNAGFDIIRSKSLKDEIIILFEHHHQQVEKVSGYMDINDSEIMSVHMDNFRKETDIENGLIIRNVPKNFEELKHNSRYHYVLNHAMANRAWLRLEIESILKQNSRVEKLIKEELREHDK